MRQLFDQLVAGASYDQRRAWFSGAADRARAVTDPDELATVTLLGDSRWSSLVRAEAPRRSRGIRVRQSSRPVLACITGALRPCTASMISSVEMPSREVPVVERYACQMCG